MRNRYYDSSIGRFITEDPAKDGLNWYSYCGGNPVIFVDPWGLAITEEDRQAYYDGRMSRNMWKLLNEADEMWNSARSDDYTTKAVAHNMAYVARSSYKGQYVDNFDYTFGTGYSALDKGAPGKYVKVSYVNSSTGSYSAITFLYYERYMQNNKNYIKIVKSNGYGSGSNRGRIYVSGIEYTYGATSTFGGNSITRTISNSKYEVIFNNVSSVPDDKGELDL